MSNIFLNKESKEKELTTFKYFSEIYFEEFPRLLLYFFPNKWK